MLPLQVRMNLGVIAMKEYYALPKAPDCLVSYPGHFLRESYPSAEMQSVYSTAPADWATIFKNKAVWITPSIILRRIIIILLF